MLELLKKTLLEAPVVKKGDYYYVVHPITDGVPYIEKDLLDDVTDAMKKEIDKLGDVDRIVTIEAMGIPLASVLSMKTGLPFTIIRKRQYGLPGEVSVEQVTGYSKSKLYINGLKKDDKIVIVDDVLSTGGTLKAVLSALKEMKVKVKKVIIAVDKGKIAKQIEKDFSVPIKSLVDIDVLNGKVVIQ